MGTVIGVLGPVDTDGPDWGPVDAHAHLLLDGGLIPDKFPDIHLHDVEACARELDDVIRAGGRVVIDATPIGLGRRPAELADLARRTGLVIVAATGFHKQAYYPKRSWVATAGVQRLTDLMLADLREGIDALDYGAPWVERTGVRAGVIKVAGERQRLSAREQAIFEAAAAAHAATGAPVTTHLEAGTFGLEQLELLRALGVAPQAVSLAHAEKNPDPGYHRELAASGAYVVFTSPGRIAYGPDSALLDQIGALVTAGLTDRVLVGGDMALRSLWRALGGGPGLGWLFSGFLARLRRELGDEVANAITIHNPARAYAWQPRGR